MNTSKAITLFFIVLIGAWLFLSSKEERDIGIYDFCVPKMPAEASIIAGYGKVVNPTDKAITIKSVLCNIATKTQIHEVSMRDDMMEMNEIKELVVKSGSIIEFAPGGKHLMIYLKENFGAIKGFIECSFEMNVGTSFTAVAELKDSCEGVD